MPATRRRRIVSRAVMALAGVVLMVTNYVSSWAMLYWCGGNGAVSDGTFHRLMGTVVLPVDSYMLSDYPGSRPLAVLSYWCYCKGQGRDVTWEKANATFSD
jgi:hypothetical protein